MPLILFYTVVQKSQKWPKTQIKGGPALTLCKQIVIGSLSSYVVILLVCVVFRFGFFAASLVCSLVPSLLICM